MELHFAQLCLASAGAGLGFDASKNEVPSVPDDAVQYNKTGVTPMAHKDILKPEKGRMGSS